MVPYCTACGNLRAPLANRSVTMTGKTSKVGGTVARVLGWLVLIFGLSIALGLGLLAYSLFTVLTGVVLGGILGIPALILGIALVRGGRNLHQTGADAQRSTREQAVFALAAHRGGVLTAAQVAETLGIPFAEADVLLTDLAKQQSDKVALEVDDQGGIFFRFPNAPWGPLPYDARFRVEPQQTRVDDRPALPLQEVEADIAPPEGAARRTR